MPLEIRPDQMRTFEEQARAKFYEDAMRLLRVRQPQETGKMSDDALRLYVEEATSRAEALGLKSEASVLQFLEIGVLPETFRQQPLIREVVTRVLANDDLPIGPRMAFLHRQIVPRAALEEAV